MLLERIDTSINLADHFTKSLLPALFHRHADFILGHIPPAYSPIYRSIIGSYVGVDDYIEKFVPSSFTTPITAAVDKHRCQLGHYDRSALAGIYVYLQKCMTGSTVSAYGDIRRTDPRLHFPTYALALTYGSLARGSNPVPVETVEWITASNSLRVI